jgi:hypothetical protein
MPKTATDPYFGLATGGRNFAAVTPSDTQDLAVVTTGLIVTIGTGGTGIAVLSANAQSDAAPVNIPLAVGTHRLDLQVRRVMATGTVLGTGGGVTALWS